MQWGNIYDLYREYKNAGALPWQIDGVRIKENSIRYKKALSALNNALIEAHRRGKLKSELADTIAVQMREEAEDPIAFWGSEKIATTNHHTYVEDKSGRLFEALVRAYEAALKEARE